MGQAYGTFLKSQYTQVSGFCQFFASRSQMELPEQPTGNGYQSMDKQAGHSESMAIQGSLIAIFSHQFDTFRRLLDWDNRKNFVDAAWVC